MGMSISTSLISNTLLDAYGCIGYILNVPPQNIISTNYSDIGFKKPYWNRRKVMEILTEKLLINHA